MRYGFWLPVFGGWLRNIDDEQMPAAWNDVRYLTIHAEDIGRGLGVVAELNLNVIESPEAETLRRSYVPPRPVPDAMTLHLNGFVDHVLFGAG